MTLPALQTVTVDGLRLAWREAGQGVPLVLLHGIGASSESWESQLAYFASDYRVVAWDAPGYGGSGDLDRDTPSAADFADALDRLLGALGIQRCHLLGHSMGALIAAAYASRHPDWVLSLTLANAASGHGKLDPETRAAKLRDRLGVLEAHGPAGMAERRAPRLVGPDASADALARVQRVMAAVRPDGYSRAARMLSEADIFGDLAHISRPTLVMCGTLDRVTSEDSNRAIAKALSDARFAALPGLGHASYVESPEMFNQVLGRFLAERTKEAA
ncbi:MAG: alpha/beta fold hydrolase [Candidatus Eiseniibacteriota bacterium]